MAGWERYGEAEKYGRGENGVNKNPKHVGESLRQLSLEDRLELRKRAREGKKLVAQATVDDDDDVDDEASKMPRHAPFVTEIEEATALATTETVASVVQDVDAVTIEPVGNTAIPPIQDLDAVVELEDQDDGARRGDAAEARRARRRAKAAQAAMIKVTSAAKFATANMSSPPAVVDLD